MAKEPAHNKYLQYIGFGAELAAVLSIPILTGYWLDTKLGTTPYLILAGMGLGILLLIGLFIRIIRDSNNIG